MERLRDTLGVKRLGIHVCKEISDKLAGVGLGHSPKDLEPDSWQEVRLFTLGTPVAGVINASLKPGSDGDDVLRESAESEANEILRSVRALVCD
ncbi:MAG: hypothetical protein WAO61_09955 [Solirubrobacterales bacterium]